MSFLKALAVIQFALVVLFGVFVSAMFDKAVDNSCKGVVTAESAQKPPKAVSKYKPSEHSSEELHKFERSSKRTD